MLANPEPCVGWNSVPPLNNREGLDNRRLDNRLDLLSEKGFKSDVTKLRFRVRQLTGFDEVEERINELI